MNDDDYIKEHINEPCMICYCDYEDDTEIIITKCRHIMCADCFNILIGNKVCVSFPQCRRELTLKDIKKTMLKPKDNSQVEEEITEQQDEFSEAVNKYGTKMTMMIRYLQRLFNNNDTDREIIFSQNDEMISLNTIVLTEFKIKHVYCKGNVNVVSKIY